MGEVSPAWSHVKSHNSQLSHGLAMSVSSSITSIRRSINWRSYIRSSGSTSSQSSDSSSLSIASLDLCCDQQGNIYVWMKLEDFHQMFQDKCPGSLFEARLAEI